MVMILAPSWAAIAATGMPAVRSSRACSARLSRWVRRPSGASTADKAAHHVAVAVRCQSRRSPCRTVTPAASASARQRSSWAVEAPAAAAAAPGVPHSPSCRGVPRSRPGSAVETRVVFAVLLADPADLGDAEVEDSGEFLEPCPGSDMGVDGLTEHPPGQRIAAGEPRHPVPEKQQPPLGRAEGPARWAGRARRPPHRVGRRLPGGFCGIGRSAGSHGPSLSCRHRPRTQRPARPVDNSQARKSPTALLSGPGWGRAGRDRGWSGVRGRDHRRGRGGRHRRC
jgi:hypothetical protein